MHSKGKEQFRNIALYVCLTVGRSFYIILYYVGTGLHKVLVTVLVRDQ
jgi:hypothetical protein